MKGLDLTEIVGENTLLSPKLCELHLYPGLQYCKKGEISIEYEFIGNQTLSSLLMEITYTLCHRTIVDGNDFLLSFRDPE